MPSTVVPINNISLNFHVFNHSGEKKAFPKAFLAENPQKNDFRPSAERREVQKQVKFRTPCQS